MAKRQVDRTEDEQKRKRERDRKHKQAQRKRDSDKEDAAERDRKNRRYAYTAYLPPNANELESNDGLVFLSRNRRSDLLDYDQEMNAFLVNALALMDMGNH